MVFAVVWGEEGGGLAWVKRERWEREREQVRESEGRGIGRGERVAEGLQRGCRGVYGGGLYGLDRRTRDADELPCALRNQLLLEQAGAAALDAVEVLVNLVGAVKRHVQHCVLGQRVERDGRQPSFHNHLPRLIPRRHEADVRVRAALFDRLDHVDDGCARPDADVGR